MGIQRLVHSFDGMLANLTLRLGKERNVLLSFLFHGLFLSTHEMQSGAVDPQQGITVDMFRTLVGHFRSHSYRFVSPGEIIQGLAPDGKYVLLTFDDGYYNNVRALSVLEEFDVPAVFFISTGHVKEQKSFWWDVLYREHLRGSKSNPQTELAIGACKRLKSQEVESRLKETFGIRALSPVGDLDRPFSPDELCEFAKHKHVRLGNHTRNHAILTNYSLTEILEQIVGAQEDIKEMTGQVPEIIAYPNGSVSMEIQQVAKEVGLVLGVGLQVGRNQLPVEISSSG